MTITVTWENWGWKSCSTLDDVKFSRLFSMTINFTFEWLNCNNNTAFILYGEWMNECVYVQMKMYTRHILFPKCYMYNVGMILKVCIWLYFVSLQGNLNMYNTSRFYWSVIIQWDGANDCNVCRTCIENINHFVINWGW